MKRLWILGLVAVAGLSLGLARRQERRQNARAVPALEVLPAGGGMSHVRPPCETLLAMGLLTGDFAYCVNGEGGDYSDGGTALTIASPYLTSVSDQACPSGPNCNTYRAGRAAWDAGLRWESSSAPNMGGNTSWSCGWFGAVKRPAVAPDLAGRGAGTPRAAISSRSWLDSSARPSSIVMFTDAGYHALGGTTAVATGPTLITQTYQYVTNSTSEHKLYINGALDGQSTTVSGNLLPATSRWVGHAGGDWGDMTVYGQFCTSTVLTLAQVQALNAAVRGTLTGSRGEAITTTRNSTLFCTNEDESAGSTLSTHQACVRKGGLLSEPAGTNLAVRSEEAQTAQWYEFAEGGATVATVTANTSVAPDGTLTADRLVFPFSAAGNSAHTLYSQYSVVSGTTYTDSFWVRGTSGSGTTYVGDWNGASGNKCTKTACNYTTSWTRCSHTYTSDQTVTGERSAWVGAMNNRGCADSGGVPATDIQVWGAQVETGAYPTSYIRTEGSTATRVASYHTISSSLADIPVGANTAYCMGATWIPPVGATAWSHVADGVSLVALGSSYRSANESFLYIDSALGGDVVFEVSDATNALKTRVTSANITFAQHRIVGCNTAGVFQVWVDGVPAAMDAASGAGTGLITTMPSTHDVGSLNSGATGYQEKGIVKDICIGPLGSCQ